MNYGTMSHSGTLYRHLKKQGSSLYGDIEKMHHDSEKKSKNAYNSNYDCI